MVQVILIFMFGIGIVWLIHCHIKGEEAIGKRVKTIAEGHFSHMLYGSYDEIRRTRRPGMAASSSTHVVKMDASVIVMEDQSTYVLSGRRDMPYPSGTHIVIKQNGHGYKWAELAP